MITSICLRSKYKVTILRCKYTKALYKFNFTPDSFRQKYKPKLGTYT